ncbi:MAG: hypothetical protein JO041_11800 [Acidobacteria bacterium]|nr:hypothetical protein [Acidobacteriota bacterium]
MPKGIDPQALSRNLEAFLGGSRDAQVLEDGHAVFDLRQASYSVSGEYGKCLVHFWSEERNSVRRVLECETRNGTLRMTVRRFGQAKPSHLEIVRGKEWRLPSARRAVRSRFEGVLQRVLAREFPSSTADRLRSTADLERTFSPVYARGILRTAGCAFAVLGVNAAEPQSAIDGSLSFGLLWLEHCRRRLAPRTHVKGLKLFVPRGSSEVLRGRMAHTNRTLAQFELWEVDEQEGSCQNVDCEDRGNILTRLGHKVDEAAARERLAPAIERVMHAAGALAGDVEVVVRSAAEISFRVRGLEFARARYGGGGRDLAWGGDGAEICFGAGAAAYRLEDANEGQMRELLARIVRDRRPGGDYRSLFWRMHPESWLESLAAKELQALDSRLAAPVYSQVPAFSAGDRAMIDLLAATRSGRLAVIELKADEDLQLPIQGLDYWARVRWHHDRNEFEGFGYFSKLSPEPPMLFLVAPALRLHPATDTLLRYISPDIEWMVIGVDERWREGIKIVFRKSRPESQAG